MRFPLFSIMRTNFAMTREEKYQKWLTQNPGVKKLNSLRRRALFAVKYEEKPKTPAQITLSALINSYNKSVPESEHIVRKSQFISQKELTSVIDKILPVIMPTQTRSVVNRLTNTQEQKRRIKSSKISSEGRTRKEALESFTPKREKISSPKRTHTHKMALNHH